MASSGSSISVGRATQVVGRPVFTTREMAALYGGSLSAASQALKRLEAEGVVVRAARGLWCRLDDPRFTSFSLSMFLGGRHQVYVSFLSALHLHGMIEQIPRVIYCATTGHTRRVDTPVGAFSLHRIDPRFFAGFDWYHGKQDFLIAGPEKALVDCLYLSSRKGRRFGRFPEIETGGKFETGKALDWIRRIPDPRIGKNVLKKFRALEIAEGP